MGPVVLVVDDEIAICENLSAFLEDEGMRVICVHSGEDALSRINAGLAIQICIMDLRLPGMSGTAAILAIQQLDPRVRFVIHTGSAQEDVAAELQRAGLAGMPVFKKPVADMADLAQAARRLVAPGR